MPEKKEDKEKEEEVKKLLQQMRQDRVSIAETVKQEKFKKKFRKEKGE
jgi:hypothetical protein